MAPDRPTVLVIDDEEDILELVDLLLSAEGLRVLTARNGAEGLAVVARQMPDLILLDLKMPVMDGRRFAEEFHARYGNSTPILVLTAADDPRRRAGEVGSASWMSKPFDVDRLVATVQALLRQNSAPSGAPAPP